MNIQIIRTKQALPDWLPLGSLVSFLHTHMYPYQDSPQEIMAGLNYALSERDEQGGFIVLGDDSNQQLIGAVVTVHTGMSGYIPENLLLFACVDSTKRGQGLGGILIEHAIDHVEGDIKLHVEYDNPAKALYERLGFTNKYAEMRYHRKKL